MDHVLDNPAWNALISNNKHLAQGTEAVKFFDKEVSPFVGFAENSDENFDLLHKIVPHNGPFGFISPNKITIPDQWQILHCINCHQMIYSGQPKLTDTDLVPVLLTEQDVPQMLTLTKLTNPGPFNSRTIDFGHYYGFFEGDELVAMAGQRMHINQYAEISAVCTHPDHLGKGYAGALLRFQIARIIAAGGTPILHVRLDNQRAIEVYERVGFVKRKEICFTIMKKA